VSCRFNRQGFDKMKQLEKARAWCPYCDSRLKIVVTQPYRTDTYRVEYFCIELYEDCEEAGIVMLMEV